MNLNIFLEWNRVEAKSNILPIVFFELTNLSAICRFCYRKKIAMISKVWNESFKSQYKTQWV